MVTHHYKQLKEKMCSCPLALDRVVLSTVKDPFCSDQDGNERNAALRWQNFGSRGRSGAALHAGRTGDGMSQW